MTEITEGLHSTLKRTEITKPNGLWEEEKYLNKQNNVMARIMMDYLLHNRKNILRSLDRFGIFLGPYSHKQKSVMCGERKRTER